MFDFGQHAISSNAACSGLALEYHSHRVVPPARYLPLERSCPIESWSTSTRTLPGLARCPGRERHIDPGAIGQQGWSIPFSEMQRNAADLRGESTLPRVGVASYVLGSQKTTPWRRVDRSTGRRRLVRKKRVFKIQR
jgi:hypothetical protein